ncbi:head-tail adaptor protein [Vibrio sp. 10N.261.52.C11]|uniref:head-tail adaptor protein n=1 Tax=Vibrio sp. 10N.261.52.C11 TaxID=3229680 RepID=UPI00354B9F6A
MVNFGRMNHCVTFVKQAEQRNEFNEIEQTYTDVVTRYAQVTNKSYSTTKDKAPIAQKVIEIRTRYISKITDDLLVKWQQELYEIDSVVDFDHSKRSLVIVAIVRGKADD